MRWVAGWPCERPRRSLGAWRARLSLKLAKSDLHWEHVVADPGPRYAYRPIVCDSWSYLRRREGAPSRHPTLHFSGWARGQEHIWLLGRLARRVSSPSFRSHPDTHPLPRLQLTCCCAAIAGVCKAAADTLAHSYTNKQTHLLLLTIGRRREDEQNKQFNLHDSRLLYISRPQQWWSGALLEAAGNEKWSSCLLFGVGTGRGSSYSWNSSHAASSTSPRRSCAVWCPLTLLLQSRHKCILRYLLLCVSLKVQNGRCICIFMQKTPGGLEPMCKLYCWAFVLRDFWMRPTQDEPCVVCTCVRLAV